MAWQTQQNDQRPERPPETPYAIAWAALLFSLIACAMSGYVLMKNVDLGEMGGKLKENLKLIESETQKVLNKPEGGAEEESASDSLKHDDAAAGAGQDGVKWDRLQERVGDIQQMAKEGDSRAGMYIESLKRDLGTLRDYTSEKGSATLDKMMTGLQEARDKLAEDSVAAADKLKKLKDDMEPQVKSAMEKARALTSKSSSEAKEEKPAATEGAEE